MPNFLLRILVIGIASLCTNMAAKELVSTNSTILLSKTNSANGNTNIFVVTQRAHLLSTNVAGKVSKHQGTIVTIQDEHAIPIWAGWFLKSSPWPGQETNAFFADLFYDTNAGCCYLVLGLEDRFGVYKVDLNPQRDKVSSPNQLPVRASPRWAPKAAVEPLQPYYRDYWNQLLWIEDLKVFRDGRYVVVVVNKKRQFKYSTWTGNWSIRDVPAKRN